MESGWLLRMGREEEGSMNKMDFLDLAKLQLQQIDGVHPIEEIETKALVAIADALVYIAEILARREE